MRFRIRYRYPAPASGPLRLYLMLPADRAGQRTHAARLSQPARELRSETDRTLACFDLAAGSRLELDFELDAAPSFERLPDELEDEVRGLLETALARLEEVGSQEGGEAPLPGGDALALALATLQEAEARGWRGELVLGHLLLTEPSPHVWCRLETPRGGVECDPWFFFILQGAPEHWLAYGLAPEPQAYLAGHEGRRVTWGTAPVPAEFLPCQEAAGGEGERFYFWPDAAWTPNRGFQPTARRELHASETGAFANLKGALDAFRVAAFAGLLLVALGLTRPGGWPLLAYAGYAALLAGVQGRAWTRLLGRPASRVRALEPVLFHAAFLAVVNGWDTVLPQTLFVLAWIYHRVRGLWFRRQGEARRPSRT